MAGGSAQREYERRRSARRATVRRNLFWTIPAAIVAPIVAGFLIENFYPGLGWMGAFLLFAYLALTFWSTPRNVTSFARGARGEALTAEVLEGLSNYVVLHDRRMPNSSANIDHIAIGAGGIFVIETKNLAGEIQVRGHDLYVGGRRRTTYVEQVWKEAVNVQNVLAEQLARLALDPVPVLCIHGVSVPRTKIQGVHLVGPRHLRKLLSDARPVLSDENVSAFASAVDQKLRRR